MTYKYKVGGKAVKLDVSPDLVAVRFLEPAPYSARAAAVDRPEMAGFENRFEVPRQKYTVFKVAPHIAGTNTGPRSAMQALDTSHAVSMCRPVFVVGENHAIAGDRLMVGFKDEAAAQGILKEQGCDIIEQNGSEFVVSIDADTDPFDVAAKLDALPQVDYAEPDFAIFGKHVARSPATVVGLDPMTNGQYALQITKAREAWQHQLGDRNIAIAILDEGVDTKHPDLAAAIVGTYDGVDDDTFQEPNPWDSHGTACAGLAAAIHNNGLGIKGLSGGCSLFAIRIAFSPAPRGNWVAETSWIRRSIDWAWTNKADVLSNSWGGGLPSTAIANAFHRARTQGRDGKGCVVVVAAGNDGKPVGFPGDLDGILTVSASNSFDEPKTWTSRDGEDWWATSHGPSVDVAAPGVNNLTTDNSGAAGYNNAPGAAGDYYSRFNGTSSSTPLVAGAAALMLSANPDLTELQVRDIIRQTADKVGPVEYTNGHNIQMGFGRLNVLAAVQAAIASRTAGLSEVAA